MAMILIRTVHPVGRHLKGLFIHKHGDGTVFNSRIHSPGKNLFYLFRSGRCGDIPILRLPSQNTVADTPADGVSLKSMGHQPFNNDCRIFRDIHFHPLHLFQIYTFLHIGILYRAEPDGARPCAALTYGMPCGYTL